MHYFLPIEIRLAERSPIGRVFGVHLSMGNSTLLLLFEGEK